MTETHPWGELHWTCECGQLNSMTRKNCLNCDKQAPENPRPNWSRPGKNYKTPAKTICHLCQKKCRVGFLHCNDCNKLRHAHKEKTGKELCSLCI